MKNELAPVATATLTPIADPQALLLRAIENNVSIDTLERLLVLRATLRAEAAEVEFYTALAAFQGECPTIPKTKSAGQGGFSYKYAPLDLIVSTVGPLLQKHGLSYTVDTIIEDTNLVAICTIHHVAGHSLASTFRVPIDKAARMNDTQKVGAASTYAKRYAFCNGLGILTGDEDTDAQQARRKVGDTRDIADAKTYVQQGAKPVEVVKGMTEAQHVEPTAEEMAELFPEPDARKARTRTDKPTEPGKISAAQHRALEAAITEYATVWGLNPEATRQRLKDHCGVKYSVEHFPELSPAQFEAIMRDPLLKRPAKRNGMGR